jgi:hypothetical protein
MKACLMITGKVLGSVWLARFARSFVEGEWGTVAAASSHACKEHRL